jgi:hypothetical protein
MIFMLLKEKTEQSKTSSDQGLGVVVARKYLQAGRSCR